MKSSNSSVAVPFGSESVEIFQSVFDQLAVLTQSDADPFQSPNLARLAFDRTKATGTVSHARLSIYRQNGVDMRSRGVRHDGIPDISRELQTFTYKQAIPNSGRESYWVFG